MAGGISRDLTMQKLYQTFTQARDVDPDTRLIQCERCSHVISPKPAATGEKRIREHPRTRFMVRPDFPEGGRRIENIIVLCGVCDKSHAHYGPFAIMEQFNEWKASWEADIARHESQINAKDDMMRVLEEDAMSAGELHSEGLARTIPLDPTIPPEALEDFDDEDGMDEILEDLSTPSPPAKKTNPIDEY